MPKKEVIIMFQEERKLPRSTPGICSIRQITRTAKGKTYTYYQARYTEGYDPGTGKQIQRSITGKTQSEVAQKMRTVIRNLCPTEQTDTGTVVGHMGRRVHRKCEEFHSCSL